MISIPKATKFVVVEMPVDKNNSKLISFLESNGYADIFCLRSLTAHPAVQKYVDEELEKKECDNCKLAETIVTSTAEPEGIDVKPEAVHDQSDTVQHNDTETEATSSMNTAPHTTESSHRLNADITNNVNNMENILAEPRIGAISPAQIVQQTDHTKLIDRRVIIKTKPAKILTITARETLTEPANCEQNHPSKQIEKDIRGVSEDSTGEVGLPCTDAPIIWLKRRGELTKNTINSEIADGKPNTATLTKKDSQNSEERLQAEPIATDNQECSGNMEGQAGNIQSPLVIWLKQRNTKQASGYRIQETKSKAEVNLSPLLNNGENSRNQTTLDASATCNDMNRSDDAEMIPTDDNHSENSDAMNTSDDDEAISTDDNDSESSEEVRQQDSFSSEHQELDESVSGQSASSPSSPTISVTRKTSKPFKGSPKSRNVRVKGAGGNKKSSKHSRSSLPKPGKDIAQQEAADIKCMVCFKDVNLHIKRKTVIESLLAHAKTHADIKQYHCTSEGCDYSCTNKIRITIHMKYNHNVHGIGRNLLNGDLRKSWVNSFERCYPTLKDELADVNRTQGILQNVTKSQDTQKCMICRKDVNTQIRGKTNLRSLLIHAQSHCEKKKFNCTSEDCDYSCASSGNARKHMKSMHNIIGTPKSKVTAELKHEWVTMFQRCYPTLENELASLKNTTQETPRPTEKCMVCLKSVQRQLKGQTVVETLLCHARHHSDLKRYHCTVEGCNYSNGYSHQTVIHMKSNHNIVGFPKDMLNDDVKKSWAESFQKCYPTLESEFASLKKTVCLLNLPTKINVNGVLKSSTRSMFAHVKVHCQKQFRCPVKDCDFSSTRVQHVTTHIKTTHGKDDKPYNAFADELKEAWQKTLKLCFPNCEIENTGRDSP